MSCKLHLASWFSSAPTPWQLGFELFTCRYLRLIATLVNLDDTMPLCWFERSLIELTALASVDTAQRMRGSYGEQWEDTVDQWLICNTDAHPFGEVVLFVKFSNASCWLSDGDRFVQMGLTRIIVLVLTPRLIRIFPINRWDSHELCLKSMRWLRDLII